VAVMTGAEKAPPGVPTDMGKHHGPGHKGHKH
jgi:hypothetical protein